MVRTENTGAICERPFVQRDSPPEFSCRTIGAGQFVPDHLRLRMVLAEPLLLVCQPLFEVAYPAFRIVDRRCRGGQLHESAVKPVPQLAGAAHLDEMRHPAQMVPEPEL